MERDVFGLCFPIFPQRWQSWCLFSVFSLKNEFNNPIYNFCFDFDREYLIDIISFFHKWPWKDFLRQDCACMNGSKYLDYWNKININSQMYDLMIVFRYNCYNNLFSITIEKWANLNFQTISVVFTLYPYREATIVAFY